MKKEKNNSCQETVLEEDMLLDGLQVSNCDVVVVLSVVADALLHFSLCAQNHELATDVRGKVGKVIVVFADRGRIGG